MQSLLLRVTMLLAVLTVPLPAQEQRFDYKVLATTKTGTMEKEMNEAAAAGYRFGSVMGGDTGLAGNEVVVVMVKGNEGSEALPRTYKLLATARTGTMQKELQAAGEQGFDYRGATVFQSALGGKEVSVILERTGASEVRPIEYKLLAASRTGTMQKELTAAGDRGFQLCGVLVGKTAFGGHETISVLKKAGK